MDEEDQLCYFVHASVPGQEILYTANVTSMAVTPAETCEQETGIVMEGELTLVWTGDYTYSEPEGVHCCWLDLSGFGTHCCPEDCRNLDPDEWYSRMLTWESVETQYVRWVADDEPGAWGEFTMSAWSDLTRVYTPHGGWCTVASYDHVPYPYPTQLPLRLHDYGHTLELYPMTSIENTFSMRLAQFRDMGCSFPDMMEFDFSRQACGAE